MTERPEPAAPAPGRLRRLGCLVLLACAACGGDTDARPAPGSPPAQAAARAAVPRAAGDSLTIHAYRSPPGFPLPFHTAVPGSFRPNAELEGDGAAVRFAWAPAGERRDSAFVYVRVMKEGTREGGAREIVRTAAERVRIPGDAPSWSPAAATRGRPSSTPSAARAPWASRCKGGWRWASGTAAGST